MKISINKRSHVSTYQHRLLLFLRHHQVEIQFKLSEDTRLQDGQIGTILRLRFEPVFEDTNSCMNKVLCDTMFPRESSGCKFQRFKDIVESLQHVQTLLFEMHLGQSHPLSSRNRWKLVRKDASDDMLMMQQSFQHIEGTIPPRLE